MLYDEAIQGFQKSFISLLLLEGLCRLVSNYNIRACVESEMVVRGRERINEEAFILREIIFFKSSTLFEMGLWTKLPLKVRQPDHWT